MPFKKGTIGNPTRRPNGSVASARLMLFQIIK